MLLYSPQTSESNYWALKNWVFISFPFLLISPFCSCGDVISTSQLACCPKICLSWLEQRILAWEVSKRDRRSVILLIWSHRDRVLQNQWRPFITDFGNPFQNVRSGFEQIGAILSSQLLRAWISVLEVAGLSSCLTRFLNTYLRASLPHCKCYQKRSIRGSTGFKTNPGAVCFQTFSSTLLQTIYCQSIKIWW